MSDNHEKCAVFDKKAVENALKNMPDKKTLLKVSEIFDAFGDITRIKIISALSYEKMCVCDIANILQLSHSAVSHQLRVLRQAGIVSATKEGKNVYYELSDEHICYIYDMGVKHICNCYICEDDKK